MPVSSGQDSSLPLARVRGCPALPTPTLCCAGPKHQTKVPEFQEMLKQQEDGSSSQKAGRIVTPEVQEVDSGRVRVTQHRNQSMCQPPPALSFFFLGGILLIIQLPWTFANSASSWQDLEHNLA